MSLTEFKKTYKPFMYPWAMQTAVEHELIHWHEEEIDLSNDAEQWANGSLTSVQKNHITQILRLFTQSDVQVGQNYCDLFIPTFKNNEIRCALLSIASREGIHQRAYALLNDTLGLPEEDYSAFLEYEEMADKIEFMQDNEIETTHGLAKAIAKTVCSEGISLFAAFVMLLNYQRAGNMLGMCKITEWSLRDETQHVNFMSKLFVEYCRENPQVVTDELKASIYQMYREGIEAEDKFIDLVYQMGEPDDLTKEQVKMYIRYIADRRLTQLGLKPNWGVEENPLPWLEWVLNEGNTNFFEQRVSEYSIAGMKGDDWGF